MTMRSSFLKTIAKVSSMTLLSRLTGFIRDVLASYLFGVNEGVDAFYNVYKIPLFLKTMLTEGGLSQGLIPELNVLQKQCVQATVQARLAFMLTWILIGLIFLCGVLFFLKTPLARWLYPSPNFAQQTLAKDMLTLLIPSLIAMVICGYFSLILQSYHRFKPVCLTPIILNLCLIGCGLGLSPYIDTPIFSQVYGILLAGILQVVYLYHQLQLIQFTLTPQWKGPRHRFRTFIKRHMWNLILTFLSQLGGMMNMIWISFLAVGTSSWLYYAERIAYLPLGVIGVAFSTVLLPKLCQSSSDNPSLLKISLKWNLWFGLGVSGIFFIFADSLVGLLFEHGAFSPHDRVMTARLLKYYSLGLIPWLFIKVLNAFFYAHKGVKCLVKISLKTNLAHFILCLCFVKYLNHDGLALASALSAWLNVYLLFHAIKKRSS